MEALGAISALVLVVAGCILFVLAILAPYFLYRLYRSGLACERMLARCQWLLEQMLLTMPTSAEGKTMVFGEADVMPSKKQKATTPAPIRAQPEPERGPGVPARLWQQVRALAGGVKKLPGRLDHAFQALAGEDNVILYRFFQVLAITFGVSFLVGLMVLAAYAV